MCPVGSNLSSEFLSLTGVRAGEIIMTMINVFLDANVDLEEGIIPEIIANLVRSNPGACIFLVV